MQLRNLPIRSTPAPLCFRTQRTSPPSLIHLILIGHYSMSFHLKVHDYRICVNGSGSGFPSTRPKELQGRDLYVIQCQDCSELTLFIDSVVIHCGSEIEKEP